MGVLRKQGALDNPEKTGRKKLVQCSEHATDTLPMPVTALPHQCFGDKCSFSCWCSSASLGRKEESFALPSRKATFQLKGDAGMSLWEYPRALGVDSLHLEQLCPSVPARGARAEITRREPGTEQRCCSCQGSPRSSDRPWDTGPAASSGHLVPAGEGCPRSMRQGCASPVQVRHLVPAPRRESREWPGMCREREPEQQEGPSLWSHQHQGWACLTPELKRKPALHWKRAAGLLQTPQRTGRGNSEPLLRQGREEEPGSAESCCLPAAPGTAEPRAVGLALQPGCARSRPLG